MGREEDREQKAGDGSWGLGLGQGGAGGGEGLLAPRGLFGG